MAFGIDDIIGAGLQIANKLIKDPQQQAALAIEAEKMKQAGEFKQIDAKLEEMREVTKRAAADMASDSWLSKNIRPLIMIYFLTLITLAAFGIVTLQTNFLEMVRSFTEYGLMFYFGGRTIEKVASVISNNFGKGAK